MFHGNEILTRLVVMFLMFLNIDVWLFVVVLRVCLQSVIVVFPDQTHLLFKYPMNMK